MPHTDIRFDQLSPKEWKLKVQAELAGLDYNEILVSDTADGIQIKPLYTKEDRIIEESQPIQTSKDWKIIGEYLGEANQDSSYLYGYSIPDKFAEKVNQFPEYLDLFFKCENPTELFSKVNFESLKNLKYISLDPLGDLARSGNWHQSQKEDFEFVENALQNFDFEKCIEINASLYQNAGANHVQQIALAMAHAVEYLELFGKETASKLYFKIAVGGNYFFEIAKIRALRKLWNLILENYEIKASTFIFAETSSRNKSVLDMHNNLIRSTLEVAAAVQGKADVIQVLTYDDIKNSNSFSEELASKQQLLIQKEAYFEKFVDPISGTYFVENLCEKMINNALELFKKIESDGGYLEGLQKGTIQKMIQKSADKEQLAFDQEKLILIGVNKFRNLKEISLKRVKTENKIRTLIKPIFPKRLAEKIENE